MPSKKGEPAFKPSQLFLSQANSSLCFVRECVNSWLAQGSSGRRSSDPSPYKRDLKRVPCKRVIFIWDFKSHRKRNHGNAYRRCRGLFRSVIPTFSACPLRNWRNLILMRSISVSKQKHAFNIN